jgi:hypothetical protein
MINMGYSLGFLAMQVLSILLVLGWIVMSIVCLVKLKKHILPPVAKAIWALIIAAIPWLGSIAFLIVRPEGTD